MTKSSETPRDLRKKLKRSTDSRNALKDKQRETQYEVKKLKNCLNAMTTSRDKWRLQCKESNLLVKDLKEELFKVNENLRELASVTEEVDLIPKKKRT